MGHFRRFKLSDYSSADCLREMAKRILRIRTQGDKLHPDEIGLLIDEWACFRELLARHEGQNKSRLDNEVEDKKTR